MDNSVWTFLDARGRSALERVVYEEFVFGFELDDHDNCPENLPAPGHHSELPRQKPHERYDNDPMLDWEGPRRLLGEIVG
jgi:hypothetical protein